MNAAVSKLDLLSPLERKVAAYVGAGYAGKEISHLLGVNETAVCRQVTAAMAKLGVANRLELALAVNAIDFHKRRAVLAARRSRIQSPEQCND